MGTNGTYRTSDFYIVAWLLSKGLQLEGLDRRNPRRIHFIFQDTKRRPKTLSGIKRGLAMWPTAVRISLSALSISRKRCWGSQCHRG
ncbi:DUF5659 domain-containing protein [Chloroflexota bacterium]